MEIVALNAEEGGQPPPSAARLIEIESRLNEIDDAISLRSCLERYKSREITGTASSNSTSQSYYGGNEVNGSYTDSTHQSSYSQKNTESYEKEWLAYVYGFPKYSNNGHNSCAYSPSSAKETTVVKTGSSSSKYWNAYQDGSIWRNYQSGQIDSVFVDISGQSRAHFGRPDGQQPSPEATEDESGNTITRFPPGSYGKKITVKNWTLGPAPEYTITPEETQVSWSSNVSFTPTNSPKWQYLNEISAVSSLAAGRAWVEANLEFDACPSPLPDPIPPGYLCCSPSNSNIASSLKNYCPNDDLKTKPFGERGKVMRYRIKLPRCQGLKKYRVEFQEIFLPRGWNAQIDDPDYVPPAVEPENGWPPVPQIRDPSAPDPQFTDKVWSWQGNSEIDCEELAPEYEPPEQEPPQPAPHPYDAETMWSVFSLWIMPGKTLGEGDVRLGNVKYKCYENPYGEDFFRSGSFLEIEP